MTSDKQGISLPTTTDVLIIGGGPAGVVSALCLARLGVDHLLVERRLQPLEHPKAHELSARSLEILKGLGVDPQQLALEASDQETAGRILFCHSINEEFGRIELGTPEITAKYARHLQSHRPYLNVSQTEVEKVLWATAREAGIRRLIYHQADILEQDASGVRCRITSRGGNGAPREVHARYVICADGAHSRNREFLGVGMVGPDKLQDFVNAYFTNDLRRIVNTPAKLYWILHPQCYGTLICHHPAKRWVLHVPIYDGETAAGYTPEVFAQRIRCALGQPDLDVHIESINSWRMTAQVAETFRRGRAFLVGDAAHRFPPTGGLGMNSGIGDAHNLCWKLAAVLQDQARDELLDSYEHERRPVIQHNCDESRRNYEEIFDVARAFGLDPRAASWMARLRTAPGLRQLETWTGGGLSRLCTAPAHRLLARFHQSPEVAQRVRSAIANQIGHFDRIGLDLGYRYPTPDGVQPSPAGPAPTEYIPETQPGCRLPHVWLDAEKTRSSRDVIDYRTHVLLHAHSHEASEPAMDCATPWPLRRVSLRAAGMPASEEERVCRELHLEPGGALLIRPDGHIAHRFPGAPVAPRLEHESTVEALRAETTP